MANIPKTSITMLRGISGDSEHARWGEFVVRYRPMMEAYLREHFPCLEADDIMLETLMALVAKLPTYRCVPKETGCSHNHLTGRIRRKALRVCARDKRRGEVLEEYRHAPQPNNPANDREEKLRRDSVHEIAPEQFAGGTTSPAADVSGVALASEKTACCKCCGHKSKSIQYLTANKCQRHPNGAFKGMLASTL